MLVVVADPHFPPPPPPPFRPILGQPGASQCLHFPNEPVITGDPGNLGALINSPRLSDRD